MAITLQSSNGFPPSIWIFILQLLDMLFVLDAHIPGNTPDACLRNRSIGISPPRLLYGRAANYGSIINLRACLRLPPVAIRLSLHGVYRSPFGSWRTCRSGLRISPLALRTYLMDEYSVFKVPRTFSPLLSLLELFLKNADTVSMFFILVPC